MNRLFARLCKDIRGTSAVEYGFLLAMIVLGLISVVSSFGGQNGSLWDSNHTKITAAMGK